MTTDSKQSHLYSVRNRAAAAGLMFAGMARLR